MAQEDLKVKLGVDARGLRAGLATAEREAERAGKSMADSLNRSKVEEIMKRQGMQADLTAAAFRSLGGAAAAVSFTAAGQSAISAALDFEATRNALLTVSDSAKQVDETLEFLRQQADRLGVSFPALAKQFAFFSAATRGTRLEGQQTRDIFLSITEASAKLGLSQEQLGGALNAVQQIISKGKVQAEELRGQLGERLPGAVQIAARALGVGTQELNKMLEQGQVLSEDFLPKFANELRRTFGTDAVQRIDSNRAAIERLKNQVSELAVEIGGPLSTAVSTVFPFLFDLLRKDVEQSLLVKAYKQAVEFKDGLKELSLELINTRRLMFRGQGAEQLGMAAPTIEQQRQIGALPQPEAPAPPVTLTEEQRRAMEQAYKTVMEAREKAAEQATRLRAIEMEQAARAAQAAIDELKRQTLAETQAFQNRQMMQAEDFEAQQERLARLQAMMGDAQTQALLQEQIRYDEQMELLYGFHEMELEALGGFHKAKEDLEKEHAKRLADIHIQGLDEQFSFTQYAKNREQTYLATLADNALSKLSTQSRKAFEVTKALSLANAVVKTAEAVQSAYAFGAKFGGPAAGAAAAALAASAGLANINAIKSAKFGGGQGAAIPGAQAPGGGVVGADGQVQGGPAQGGGPQQVTISIPQDAILSGRALAELISQATSNGAVIVGVNG